MKKLLIFLLFIYPFIFSKPVLAQNNLNCYINSFATCVIDLAVPSSCDPGFALPDCSPYPDCCQIQNTQGPGICNNVSCIPVGSTPTNTPTPTPIQNTNPCTLSGNSCYAASCPSGQVRISVQCFPSTDVCCTNAPPSSCPSDGSCKPTCDPIDELEFDSLNNSCSVLNPPQKCCIPTSASYFQPTSPTLCGGGTGIPTAIGCIPVATPQAFAAFLIRWAMGIAGGLALALIGYSGFMIMSSRGDPQKLQAGKELLTGSISGLILLLFGVFALRFIGIEILGLNQFGFGPQP